MLQCCDAGSLDVRMCLKSLNSSLNTLRAQCFVTRSHCVRTRKFNGHVICRLGDTIRNTLD
jgi:hypothetical protein